MNTLFEAKNIDKPCLWLLMQSKVCHWKQDMDVGDSIDLDEYNTNENTMNHWKIGIPFPRRNKFHNKMRISENFFFVHYTMGPVQKTLISGEPSMKWTPNHFYCIEATQNSISIYWSIELFKFHFAHFLMSIPEIYPWLHHCSAQVPVGQPWRLGLPHRWVKWSFTSNHIIQVMPNTHWVKDLMGLWLCVRLV